MNPRFKPQKTQHNEIINNLIKAQNIRIVKSEAYDGTYTWKEAQQIAVNEGCDLIQLNHIENTNTAICILQELSKFLYDKKKKDKDKKNNAATSELHEVRLSPDISENDVTYRVKKAIEWLKGNDKVKLTLKFAGRQIAFKEKGELVILKFAEAVKEYGTLETMPQMNGKIMNAMLKPKKV